MRRRLIPLLVLLLCSTASAREEDLPPTESAPDSIERPDQTITRDQVDAVARGLAWLARPGCQEEDGSWSDSTQSSNATIAVTSLTLLAFMANGNTETRGKYARQVREGVKFLLRHVTLTPDGKRGIPVGYIWVPQDEYSRMHGHGYATTVLALAYGMGDADRRKDIRRRLELAVNLIERSQHETGGWYYLPRPERHEGSVTVCEVQALRTAREAGIKVSKSVVDRAIRYLERSQDAESGGFCYSLSDRKRQTFALTAAALSTLFGLGGYDRSPMIEKGLKYMELRSRSRLLGRQTWFYYGTFYAAQSLWQAAAFEKFSPYWRDWWPTIREHLVNEQNPPGYWLNRGSGADVGTGRIYATAMATLILQVPMGILPMFQR